MRPRTPGEVGSAGFLSPDQLSAILRGPEQPEKLGGTAFRSHVSVVSRLKSTRYKKRGNLKGPDFRVGNSPQGLQFAGRLMVFGSGEAR